MQVELLPEWHDVDGTVEIASVPSPNENATAFDVALTPQPPERQRMPTTTAMTATAAEIIAIGSGSAMRPPSRPSSVVFIIFITVASAISTPILGASETNIVEAGIPRALASEAYPVGAAIAFGAKPGPASRHAHLTRGWAFRVLGGAVLVVIGRVPVSGPLPHVPDHVVEAEAVWREAGDRRGVIVSVLQFVIARPCFLPEIRYYLAIRLE